MEVELLKRGKYNKGARENITREKDYVKKNKTNYIGGIGVTDVVHRN